MDLILGIGEIWHEHWLASTKKAIIFYHDEVQQIFPFWVEWNNVLAYWKKSQGEITAVVLSWRDSLELARGKTPFPEERRRLPKKQSGFTLSITRDGYFAGQSKVYNLVCGACRAAVFYSKQNEAMLLEIVLWTQHGL